MSTSDGYVIGTTKILDNGPPDKRFNLVILSEGYKENEIDKFHTDTQNFVNQLHMTKPFDQVWHGFNIYRVDVASTDSGADDPTSSTNVKTYFDATFWYNIDRLLTANYFTALTVAGTQVPQYHAVMMLVNSPKYGGSGRTVGIGSTHTHSGEIMIHEMGHTVFGLADEYSCDPETDRNRYPGSDEPSQPNITINTNRTTNKWREMILSSTPIPTMSNEDCTKCDLRQSPVPAGTVGLFEGADFYHCGLYRPEYDCKMRNLGVAFCTVCQKRIIDTMIPYIQPIFKMKNSRASEISP
jgi:IgA Peptidase M64